MKYLCKVKRIFYYRRRTPEALKEIFKSNFIRFSLKTDNKKFARMLTFRINASIEEVIMGLRLRLITQKQAQEKLQSADVNLFQNRNSEIANEKIMLKRQIKGGEKISSLFAKFKLEKITSKRWIEKTGLENQRCFDLFLTFAGDYEPQEYNHQTFLQFKSMLQKLPPNMNSNPRTRNKSLSKILSMKHDCRLGESQINKYLICVSSFFGWLQQHEILEQNPAHHLLISRAKRKRPDLERSAFTKQEIVLMLDELRQQRQGFGIKQSRFWVPTIAAYSGMRLTEICQLYLEDIVEINNIWCFDINEKADKRLKTAASARIIPIHPSLISNGLIEFVNELRINECKRLFPELKKEKYNGYGRQMSKVFTSFNRRFISTDPKKTFHSIRHSVANQLKQKGVATEIISELLGHHINNITISRYGKKYEPSIILKAIKNLPW